jgi:3-oxoacyl-[acyl-carrier-protein] synthase-1
VHVIAVAARTPAGFTAEATAAAVRAGISRVGEHPFLINAEGDPLLAAHDKGLDPKLMGGDRHRELVRHALREIGVKLGSAGPLSRQPIPLLLGLPETRPGFDETAAHRLLRACEKEVLPSGDRIVAREAGRGHAGAMNGLAQALERIAGGREELLLVGGVDGYLDADALEWLDADMRLARENRRGGFHPGEAAAMIALVSDGLCRRLGLASLGVLRAVACAEDDGDENAPEGLMGHGLTQVYKLVGSHLALPSERFDDFYCDINGERARTTDLGFALLRTGQLFRDGNSYVSPVRNIGDVGAASAPLSCILAVRAWSRGYAAGRTAIVSGASWRGLRGAALFEQGGR